MEQQQEQKQEVKLKTVEFSDRIFKTIAVFLAVIAAVQAFNAWLDFKNSSLVEAREFTVSATGKSFVKPDIALVQFGVTTQGEEVSKITSENNEKIAAIVGDIKALGTQDKDIQTVNYSLTPNYVWSRYSSKIQGYTLTQQVAVKVREFSKLGDIMVKATEKGANMIGDFQFEIEDTDKIKEAAREQAIEKAKAQADLIAKQSGLKLDKLVNVIEGGYYYPQADYRANSVKSSESGAAGPATALEPGQQEISVNVTLVYKVK